MKRWTEYTNPLFTAQNYDQEYDYHKDWWNSCVVCVWERERGEPTFFKPECPLNTHDKFYREEVFQVTNRPCTSIHLVEVNSLKHCPHPPSTFQFSFLAWYLHKLQHWLPAMSNNVGTTKEANSTPSGFLDNSASVALLSTSRMYSTSKSYPSNLDNDREAEWLSIPTSI